MCESPWVPVGDQRALIPLKALAEFYQLASSCTLFITCHILLLISTYPTRVHLEQAPVSSLCIIILLLLSRDAAALLCSSTSSDQMTRLFYPVGLLLSLCSPVLSIVSPPAPPTPFLGLWEYNGLGAFQRQEVGLMKLMGMRVIWKAPWSGLSHPLMPVWLTDVEAQQQQKQLTRMSSTAMFCSTPPSAFPASLCTQSCQSGSNEMM